MSTPKFHTVLSCTRWETLQDLVHKYLCRDHFIFEEVRGHEWILKDGKGRIGTYLIRENRGRLRFGYIEY
jgi:hypothetical protein